MMRVLFAGGVTAAALFSTSFAQNMRPDDVNRLPESKPNLIESYGADPLQYGELRLPAGKGPFPVAVVIHGGCWTKGYATLRNTSPLATDLTAHGVATWNIEYRQVGDKGGGWPGSFTDWDSAIDHLRVLARKQPLDLKRVILVGHSAGAFAAVWASARDKLPTSSEVRGDQPLKVRAAVAVDGPVDLSPFIAVDKDVCGRPVIVPFMGATPAEQPQRYAQVDSSARLPLGTQQYLVASTVLDPDTARAYRTKAAAAGDKVELLEVKDGGHFDIIAPGTSSEAQVRDFILKAIPRR